MNIFISYNRQTEAIAKALVNDVEALGHTTWFDHELSGGQAWWDQILSNISRCDLFVFVLDPASLNSIACRREYGYAADLRKPILPILVSEGVSTKLLPPSLSQIEFVDYRNQDRTGALRLARAFGAVPPPVALPDPLPVPPEVPISYLGSLAAKVETTSLLTYEEQSALVFDLKKGLRELETANDTRTLLKTFRKRHDLLARIAEEIDQLLEGLRETSSTRAVPSKLEQVAEPRNEEQVPIDSPALMPAAATTTRTERLAVSSFVLGLVSLVFPYLLAVPAIICGHLAVSKIKKHPHLRGRPLAIAGCVLGYVGILFLLIILISAFATK